MLKKREMTFPVQTAKCTLGPSLPTDRPDAIANGNPMDLISNVHAPRKPFITKPAMMHLISEIPEPAAYGANDLTKVAEMKAKRIYLKSVQSSTCTLGATYRKEEIYDVVQEPKWRPVFPFRTPTLSAPAAELLIQVESSSTIPQLDI